MATEYERERVLDTLDKFLSWPFFSVQFFAKSGGKNTESSTKGALCEWILSVPGVWFGVPSCALVWLSTVLVLVDDPPRDDFGILTTRATPYARRAAWAGVVCVPLFLALLYRWICLVRAGNHYPMYDAKRMPYYLAAVFAACELAPLSKHGLSLPCFYVSAYLFTQIFVLALKYTARRMRPGICLEMKLNRTKRYLPTLNYKGKKGATVLESFPSGDVAGAAVFSYVLFIVTGNYASFAFAFASAFGRMYFWAHHLGDVVVGFAFGCAGPALLHRLVGWEQWTVFYGVGLSAVSMVLIRKFLPTWLRKPVPKMYQEKEPPVRLATRATARQVW
eukprot:g2147.t1